MHKIKEFFTFIPEILSTKRGRRIYNLLLIQVVMSLIIISIQTLGLSKFYSIPFSAICGGAFGVQLFEQLRAFAYAKECKKVLVEMGIVIEKMEKSIGNQWEFDIHDKRCRELRVRYDHWAALRDDKDYCDSKRFFPRKK